MALTFGQKATLQGLQAKPDSLSRGDKFAILAATLRDVGAALNGGQGDAVMNTQALIGQRAATAKRQSMQDRLDGLLNPPQPYTGSGPGVDGEPVTAKPNLPKPRLPTLREALPTILEAARAGVDIKPYMEGLDKAGPSIKIGPDGRAYDERDPEVLSKRFGNPTVVNGKVINLNDDKNLDEYVPEAPVKGAVPVYGPEGKSGRIMGWQMPNGALQAIEGVEAATSRGRAAGSAPYEFISVQDDLGRPVTVAKSIAAGGKFVGQDDADAEYQKKGAQAAADRFQKIQESGQRAAGTISKYQQLDRLLGDFEGGKLAPAGLELASALNSLGFKMSEKMSNAQAADAIAKQITLDSLGGSLGTAISNGDRDFIEKTQPSLQTSAAGRRTLVQMQVKMLQRQQQVAEMARKWQQKYGRIDAVNPATRRSFDDNLAIWAQQNNLFGER